GPGRGDPVAKRVGTLDWAPVGIKPHGRPIGEIERARDAVELPELLRDPPFRSRKRRRPSQRVLRAALVDDRVAADAAQVEREEAGHERPDDLIGLAVAGAALAIERSS